MQLPDVVKQIRSRYVAKFPVPQGDPKTEPFEDIEERVRQWTFGLAEQVVFELPSQGYGSKRADGGRPITKDGLAQQAAGRLLVWDMVTGAGTGQGTLTPDPQSEDITGQVFVSVTPRDHLGVSVPDVPPPPPPPVPPYAGDFLQVLAALQAIEQRLTTIEGEQSAQSRGVVELLQRPPVKLPIAFTGAVGYRLRLTPEY